MWEETNSYLMKISARLLFDGWAWENSEPGETKLKDSFLPCGASALFQQVAFSTRQRTWKDSLSHPALLILHRAPLFSTSIFKFSCLHFHRLPFSSTSSSARVLNELGHTPPSHHAHVCPACFSGIELQERQSEVVIAISTVESGY